MNMTEKAARIAELLYSDGGIGFLKIRMSLEELESAIDDGDELAIRFGEELDHVLRFMEYAVKRQLNTGT